MILSNDKKLVAYNEDFKPMQVYGNGVRLGGYKEETYNGKNILAVDTYNDVLTVTVNGHHEQDKKYLANFNQQCNHLTYTWLISSENGVNVFPDTAPTTPTQQYFYSNNSNDGEIVKGHIYYMHGKIEGYISGGVQLAARYGTIKSIIGEGDGWVKNNTIIRGNGEFWVLLNKMADTVGNYFYYGYRNPDIVSENLTMTFQAIDLTQMFGEGNEPTTAQQCKDLFGSTVYPYNEGTWEEIDLPTVNPLPTPEHPKEIRVLENPKIKIGSKEIVWNQLIDKTKTFNVSQGTLARESDDVFTFTWSTSNLQGEIYQQLRTTRKGNHTYYLKCDFFTNDSNIRRFYFTSQSYITRINFDATIGEWNNLSTIAKSIQDRDNVIFQFGASRLDTNISSSYSIRNMVVIDLTEMFGEGAEPQTVEEFRRLFPKDYYPYDSGTTKTLSTLFDTYKPTEEVETILPFKLYGNGTVNDTCEPCVKVGDEWKCRVTRRWGSVDLGSLNWRIKALGEFDCFWYIFNDKFNDYSSLCSAYSLNNLVTQDKTFAPSRGSQGSLYIRDDSYTDVETFKQSVQGVKFVYPLLEPTIELYDPIPIRTLPIVTQIECDGEMEAVIKSVDLQ